MEHVKDAGDNKIFKKRSGRYCVKSKDGKYINGEEKAKILFSEKLIKLDPPKAKPAEEPAAEESAAEEAPAE